MTLRVLTVGINQPAAWTTPSGERYWFEPLLGTDDDAHNAADLFARAANAEPVAEVLCDAEGDNVTAVNILNRIAALTDNATPGDAVCVAMSGHGLQLRDGTAAFMAKDRGILRSELTDALDGFDAGVTVVVVLDACHAQGMIEVDVAPRPVWAPMFKRAANPAATHPRKRPGASRFVMLACEANESAGEISNGDGCGGVFIRALAESWDYGAASWQDWFDNAYRLIDTQDPQLTYAGPDPAELTRTPFA